MENAERVLVRIEQLGEESVREMISSGRWPANYHALARDWLHNQDKDAQDCERNEEHGEAQLLLGQSAPIPPEQTGIPESNAIPDAEDTLTKKKSPLLGVSLLAMSIVALSVLWDTAMRPADSSSEAKASTAAAKTSRMITSPAIVEQDGRLRAPVKHPGYTEMTLRDFVLDRSRLIGRKVRVTGLYQQMGDFTLLAASDDDMNPIDLDIIRLPRKERSALLDCPSRDCKFQVEGRVRMSRSGVIVRADDVQEVQEN
jgi:hypothetical protein